MRLLKIWLIQEFLTFLIRVSKYFIPTNASRWLWHHETTHEENVEGDVLQDAFILALDNTNEYSGSKFRGFMLCYTP